MPDQIDPEVRKKRIATFVKVGVLLVVGFIVAPVIFLAIKGIVGLAIAGVLGFAAVQMAPVFAMKIANARVALVVSEAQKNPIETMTNVYIHAKDVVATKDAKIREFEGSLGDYHDKVLVLSKKYPEEAAKYQDIEAKMARGLASQKRKQTDARKALTELNDQISKAKTLWDMANATQDILAASGSVQQEVFEDIKRQVSFDSVNHRVNTAVAALNAMDDDADASEGLRLLSGDQSLPITRKATATVAKEA